MELAGAVAAAVTGAHHVVHGLGLLPPTWVWETFTPIVQDLARRAGVRHPAEPTDATYLRISPPSLQPAADVPWSDVRLVRPAFGAPSPADRMPPGLDELLAPPGDPVVHLTLGTVFHETPGVLATAIEGLGRLRIRLVVTTGPGVGPGDFAVPPPNVRIVEYVPHALFLRHCDVVVSHGGAGIMFGALVHGVPQLLLPQGADQFANADACRAAGVALTLQPDEVTAEEVGLAVRRLLVSPSFWANAARVRREIDALPAPGEVLAGLLADAATAA
jgi:UDP:flavonoid glycosyltransferase YjiC (YdhE family)